MAQTSSYLLASAARSLQEALSQRFDVSRLPKSFTLTDPLYFHCTEMSVLLGRPATAVRNRHLLSTTTIHCRSLS